MTATTLYALYALLAVAASGVYLAMPSTLIEARRLRQSGALLAALGAIGLAFFMGAWIGDWDGRAFFVVFALIAVAAAVRVVTHPRPVYSAVYFVLVVLAVAGLVLLAAAEFLAVALVIVYGGAILVTYVFVIMLAQQSGEAGYDSQAREPFAAVLMGFILIAATTQAMAKANITPSLAADESIVEQVEPPGAVRLAAESEASAVESPAEGIEPAAVEATSGPTVPDAETGNTKRIGAELMTGYIMAIQVAGVLLLVAMVGAIVIAQKKIDPEDMTPFERQKQEGDLRERGRRAVPF